MFAPSASRARAIADGPGTARDKLTLGRRLHRRKPRRASWFPPIMLREVAEGGRASTPTRSR